MTASVCVVLDVGKTVSKLTLWSSDGVLVARRTRPNDRPECHGLKVLDTVGIEGWLGDVLTEFAALGPVGAIVPVAHGAAAAIVRDGRLVMPPLDYEQAIPRHHADAYDRLRDPSVDTGSPRLPLGLNLGQQLHFLQQRDPTMFDGGAAILLWPQYWAWRLSGVMASEATSLGSHSDLWRPADHAPSSLARAMGWDVALPPLRRADEAIGTLSPEWVARTGLSANVDVHCGIHDSNAALVAARAFDEVARQDATIVSTGTWFIAMRSGADPAAIPALDMARDCLMNVDADGCATPSARFMGGREIETLIGIDTRRVDIKPDQPALLAAVPGVIADGDIMLLPGFAPGTGPFPDCDGRWVRAPDSWIERRAAVSLYAALMLDASLDLIGARDTILIEGRFAEAEVFVGALAALRPDCAILVSNAHNDVSFGALRLVDPTLRSPSSLRLVAPIAGNLAGYRNAWRTRILDRDVAA